MTIVYVLVAIMYSGHVTNTIVPTLEFKTMEKCQAAIETFVSDARGKSGSARFRCVKIEK